MMDHEKASELLAPFARGELSEVQTHELAAHLEGCDDCTLELRALQALLLPTPDEALTDEERTALHRGVAAAVSAPPANVRVIAPAPVRGSRLAPWLGVAATVLLLGFGITQIDLGGGGQDDASSARGAGGEGATSLEDSSGGAPVEVGGPDISGGGGSGAVADALEGASVQNDSSRSAAESSGSRIPARFDPDAGAFRSKDLKSYAATKAPFRTFADAYEPSDAESLQDAYLEAIENAAPAGSRKDLIRTCARQVLEQDFPIIPAYGAFGRFEGRDVLVLGFVYAPSDRLNRYLVWVWPRGDCRTPVKIIAGRII